MANRPSAQPRIISGPVSVLDWKARVWLVMLLLLALAAGGALGFLAGQDRLGIDAERQLQLQTRLQGAEQQVESLKRRQAVAERDAQVTQVANQQLREEVASLEDDIAGLRADVEFYRRLLGAGGSQGGLAVHALQLQGTSSKRVYRFQLTLSQNLKRARVIDGRVDLSVEGIVDDRTESLDAAGLELDPAGMNYEFKYFQQLEGSLSLPKGFAPERVVVTLHPDSGRRRDTVQRTFEWSELFAATLETTGDDEGASAGS